MTDRGPLDVLMVEAAFPNEEIELCRRAGHYCPELLASDLGKLKHKAKVYISHNKPGAERKIFSQCQQAIQTHEIHPLNGGVRFKL